MPRAGAEALAVDDDGCPDLDGGYRLLPPDERGHSPRRSVRQGLSESLGGAPVERARGVRVRRLAAGAYEFRFVLPDSEVAQSLRGLRLTDRRRYSEWYHALQPQRRAAFVAGYGEARYAELLRALGPQAEVVTVVCSGTGSAACRDGWLELPREYADPIRLTRGADGSLLGEAGQLQTYDIPIWCGDGCKDLPIPTGTYTATLRWPRDDALKPWDALASGSAIERPLDEIEAEQQAAIRAQQRADSARYLADGSIRERLQALAPDDTRVDAVDVTGGRVSVRYVAPTEDTETLLRRIEQAGLGIPNSRPQEVRTIVATTRQFERTVEFVLTDSPLVLRDPPAPQTAAAGDGSGTGGAAAPAAAVPALAPLSAGPASADAAAGPRVGNTAARSGRGRGRRRACSAAVSRRLPGDRRALAERHTGADRTGGRAGLRVRRAACAGRAAEPAGAALDAPGRARRPHVPHPDRPLDAHRAIAEPRGRSPAGSPAPAAFREDGLREAALHAATLGSVA